MTKLTIPVSTQVFKRFTGGKKPIGHVHKIWNIFNNKSLLPSTTSSLNNIINTTQSKVDYNTKSSVPIEKKTPQISTCTTQTTDIFHEAKQKGIDYQTYNKSIQTQTLTKVEEQVCLIESYEERDIVSGLATLTPKEMALINEDSALGKEFRSYLIKLQLKPIFHFFENEKKISLDDLLKDGFKNFWGFSKHFEVSKELSKQIGDRFIVLLQSTLIRWFNNRDFDYNTLKKFCKENINYDSFKEINDNKMMLFIEIANIYHFQALLKKNNLDNFIFYLANPNKLSEMPVYFLPLESKHQTSQKHSDCLIGEKDLIKDFYRIYYDIKSYLTMDMEHRRFCLFPACDRLYIKLYNDMRIGLQRNFHKGDNVKELYNKITFLKQQDLSYKERFKEALNILVQAAFDTRHININPSIAIDSGYDQLFDDKYTSDLEKIIQKFAVSEESKEFLTKIFKSGSTINKEENGRTLEQFLKIIFLDDSDVIVTNFKSITLS